MSRSIRALVVPLLTVVLGCGGSSGRPTGDPVPIRPTTRTVQGQISYYPTGPLLSPLDANGRLIPTQGFAVPNFPVPAPRIPVQILAVDGTILAETVTDGSGRYSALLNYGPLQPATSVRVRVKAEIKLPFGTFVRVYPNRSATEPYTHTSALLGNPDNDEMTANFAIPLDDGAGAYHIVDVLYEGFIVAKAGIVGDLADLDVYWEHGNGDVSTYEKDGDVGRLTVAGGVTGVLASNRDVWDPPKLMRLMGEHLLAFHFLTVEPPGTPNDALLVPSAAWREGLLDFWACAGNGSAIFYDTEGFGSEGRVVRYFNVDSFFDASLPPVGPDDPNVYQAADANGIGSRFSVAEILWDIHKFYPLYLSFRVLDGFRAGADYPYLYTLLDAYAADGSLSPITIDNILVAEENQGLAYPATPSNGLVWPPQLSPDGTPGQGVGFPYQETISGQIDTVSVPTNFEVGFRAKRYYRIDVISDSSLTASVSTSGAVTVEILDFANQVLVGGPSPQKAIGLRPGPYIIRVSSAADPQVANYILTVSVGLPAG